MARRVMTAAVAVMVLVAVSAPAQTSHATVPEAPQPHPSGLSASLSSNASPLRIGAGDSDSAAPLAAGAMSLYTVVDLALRNDKGVQAAEAEAQHARASMLEMRNAYIPNFSLGSGLGYSYGFPLGNPTLFNVTSTSLLFSFSQHDYIRSAASAFKAATLRVKNARQQVILDGSLNYIELDKTSAQIGALTEAIADTDKLVAVVEERLNAGVEDRVSLTRAQLTRAKIQLRAMQMEDHAEELRQHLSGLTGVPADSIRPVAGSIPPLPSLDFRSLIDHAERAPLVQAAFATAESRKFSAIGDKNQNYRPTVGMAFQYARFAPFNGYSLYYQHFTYNNIGVGIQAVWPLFDPIRRDKAMESKAEAVRAKRQAELVEIQTNEGNYGLWHNLRELKAQAQVAKLQRELAQDTLAAIETEMNQRSATAGAAPVTPQQADEYRIEERTDYVDMRDAEFNVTRAKLNLLNAVGGLEDWAKEAAQPANASAKVESNVQHP